MSIKKLRINCLAKLPSVFAISLQQEFVYRTNFIMWRFRNIIQFLLMFFLWDSVFTKSVTMLFGYTRTKILTYVFGLIFIRAFVLSARAVDIAGDVARGELSNYLLKPISYFSYWFTRDLSSKSLNLIFAFFEGIVLFLIFKPPFFVQPNLGIIVLLVLSVGLAMLIYFLLLLITSAVPFWYPEVAWGAQFLMSAIFVEFLSGGIFPLDVFPQNIQTILSYTPFPYLIYFPIQLYMGIYSGGQIVRGIIICLIWVVLLWLIANKLWKKGLEAYQAYGR